MSRTSEEERYLLMFPSGSKRWAFFQETVLGEEKRKREEEKRRVSFEFWLLIKKICVCMYDLLDTNEHKSLSNKSKYKYNTFSI